MPYRSGTNHKDERTEMQEKDFENIPRKTDGEDVKPQEAGGEAEKDARETAENKTDITAFPKDRKQDSEIPEPCTDGEIFGDSGRERREDGKRRRRRGISVGACVAVILLLSLIHI